MSHAHEALDEYVAEVAMERATEALRESERRFRAFTNATSDVVYQMSPDWSEMRQLRGREFIADTLEPSRSWLDKYIHPHDQQVVLETINRAIATKGVYELEHRVIRTDGSLGWTHSRAIPILDDDGTVLEWFGTASDITRRKEAEESLAHQRRLYEGVLSTTPDLAYIFDLHHRFIYANEGLLKMWGKTWDEAIGKNCLELGYEPWHAEMHDREIDQVVSTKQPIRGVVPFTGTFGRRLYDYIFTPVFDANGEVQAVAGTTRDVTDIKQTEQALRESEEQLAAELAGMTRLHELSMRLAKQDDLEEVMRVVMEAAGELLGADRCTAQLFDARDQLLRLVASKGFDQDFVDRFRVVDTEGCSTCAAVLARRERVIVEDLAAASQFDEFASLAAPMGIRAVMSTPLLADDGQLLGAFTTYWPRAHAPSEHQLRHLDLYVQQAARQIERRAAERALRESQEKLATEVADLETLRRLSMRVGATADRAAALNDVLETAIRLVGADKGNVQLYDAADGALKIIAHSGFTYEFLEEFKSVPLGYSCCGAAMEQRDRVIIEDVYADERFSEFGPTYERHGFLAVQSTPLLTSDGRLLGMFSTHFAEPYRFSERDLRLLDQIAQQAGRIIERTSAESALREHAATLEILNRVGATLSAELDTQKLIQAVTDAGTDLSGAKFGAFFFNAVNEQGESYLLYTLSGAPREAFEKFGLPRNTPIFAPTFAGQGIVRSDDITKDPRYGTMTPHHGMPQGHLPVRSYLAVPVVSRFGSVLGGLFFGHPEVGVFSERSERLIGGVAAQAAIALDNAQLYQAARDSESRFRMLADNMAQLAWTCDRLGDVTWYNKQWLDYTGLTFDEMNDWGWKRCHHPDHVDRVVASVTRSRETGEAWEDTFPLRSKDGEYRWFLSRAYPIRDDKGQIVRWFGTNTDITDQRAAEEALRDADRRKDEFLATLAHELRNPLAPIRSGLEVMKIAKDDPDVLEEIQSTMVRQTEQLVRLIDDLMDVSRITRGKLKLQRQQVELKDIVKSAIEATRPFVEEKGHQLTVELPRESTLLDVDPHRLTQVLSNLLQNSAKYSPDPGPINLVVRRDDGHVELSVKDRGLGIPGDKLNEVFTMFAQIGRSAQSGYTGLGIGLTLAKSFVEMHGGTIEARSAGVGQGSEFVVRLPDGLKRADERRDRNGDEQPLPSARKRVLVVDDNEDAARMLSLCVQVLGHDVRIAHDGIDAVDAAAEFRPDVVLLDLGMPRMDGCEAAKHIRQMPWAKDTVLVALTGWGQDEDRRRTKAAGFNHHLVKPADPAMLKAIFAELQAVPRHD